MFAGTIKITNRKVLKLPDRRSEYDHCGATRSLGDRFETSNPFVLLGRPSTNWYLDFGVIIHICIGDNDSVRQIVGQGTVDLRFTSKVLSSKISIMFQVSIGILLAM